MLLGAPTPTDSWSGGAYLVSGRAPSGPQALGQAARWQYEDSSNQGAGSSISSADGLDGGGAVNLIVGAPGGVSEPGFAGEVLVFAASTGSVDREQAVAVVTGEQPGAKAGTAVAAGDVDGDGWSDLVVAAPEHQEFGVASGAVFVLYGPVSGDISLADADHRVLRDDGVDQDFGKVLAFAVDLAGDGYGNLVIGEPMWEDQGLLVGAVFVFSGGESLPGTLGQAPVRVVGDVDGGELGRSVAVSGGAGLATMARSAGGLDW